MKENKYNALIFQRGLKKLEGLKKRMRPKSLQLWAGHLHALVWIHSVIQALPMQTLTYSWGPAF